MSPNRGHYWRDVAERAVRAFAQGMLAALGVGTTTFAHGGLPWADAAMIGFGSAIISLLMSLAGSKIGDKSSGSFLPAQGSAHPSQPPAPASRQPIEAVYTPLPQPGNPPLPNWTPPPAPPVPSAAPPLPAQFVAPAAEYVGRHRAKEPGNAAP